MYNGNYFDLDDILASQPNVQCKFEIDIPKLGFFDINNKLDDLKKGSKLELPCWLAEGLTIRRKRSILPIISTELPKTYRNACRQILQADAHVIDLHRFGSYFYDFGRHLMLLCTDERDQICHTLVQTFVARFRNLMDKSNNSSSDVKPTNLDKKEKQIYDVGQRSMNEFVDWQSRKMEKLTAAQMITNQTKRKFSDLITPH